MLLINYAMLVFINHFFLIYRIFSFKLKSSYMNLKEGKGPVFNPIKKVNYVKE